MGIYKDFNCIIQIVFYFIFEVYVILVLQIRELKFLDCLMLYFNYKKSYGFEVGNMEIFLLVD